MKIRILLADNNKITRYGLKSLINSESNMEVVGEAEDGRDAVKLSNELKPDIIIMEINIPGLNGIDATRQIKEENSEIKIISFSMHSERRYVIGMIKAGASGYLLKNCDFDELINAVNTVMAGESHLSKNITHIILDGYMNNRSIENNFETVSLSERQREVLQLISEGLNSIQIASKLHLSEKTISTHKRKIMEKLNIYHVAGLTKFAVREGITSLEE